jgi:predicted ester cyclase
MDGQVVVRPSFGGRPMRGSLVWFLSLVLAVATGAALARTAAVATVPIVEPVDSDQRTAEVVGAFYEAANAVIRTGDASALEPIVAPDFFDHTVSAGVTPDRAGLGRYLAAIHATTPAARLSVEELVAVGDRAMARVTLRADVPREFLGAPVRGVQVAWGTLDVFRVADRRVAERWGDAANPVFLETLRKMPLSTRLPIRAGIALEHVALRPGDRVVGPAAESRLLFLEAGTLTLSIGAESKGPVLFTGTDGMAEGEAAGRRSLPAISSRSPARPRTRCGTTAPGPPRRSSRRSPGPTRRIDQPTAPIPPIRTRQRRGRQGSRSSRSPAVSRPGCRRDGRRPDSGE